MSTARRTEGDEGVGGVAAGHGAGEGQRLEHRVRQVIDEGPVRVQRRQPPPPATSYWVWVTCN